MKKLLSLLVLLSVGVAIASAQLPNMQFSIDSLQQVLNGLNEQLSPIKNVADSLEEKYSKSFFELKRNDRERKKIIDAQIYDLNKEIKSLERKIEIANQAKLFYGNYEQLKNESPVDTLIVKVINYEKFMEWCDSVIQDYEITGDRRYYSEQTYFNLRRYYIRPHSDLKHKMSLLNYEDLYEKFGDVISCYEMKIMPRELTAREVKMAKKEAETAALNAGYEWVFENTKSKGSVQYDEDNEFWEYKEFKFPKEYAYWVNKEHPEYQIIHRSKHTSLSGGYIFKDNKLVRVVGVDRNSLDYSVEVIDYILQQDFKSNKYNIQNESKGVIDLVKYFIGLANYEEIKRGYSGLLSSRMEDHKKAIGYVEQLFMDHSDCITKTSSGADYFTGGYIYKSLIEKIIRVDGVTFEAYLTNGIKVIITYSANLQEDTYSTDVKVEPIK